MICLDLDNEAADTIDQKRGPDQLRRDLMHAAVEKAAFQRLAEARGGRCGRFDVLDHFEVGIGAEQAGMLPISGTFC